jgi:hypothetical protein
MPINPYSRPGGTTLLIWRDCISFNAQQELIEWLVNTPESWPRWG